MTFFVLFPINFTVTFWVFQEEEQQAVHYLDHSHGLTGVVRSNVDMVGEDSGEHGSVEERGHDHQPHHGALVAARQANANQANGGDQRC